VTVDSGTAVRAPRVNDKRVDEEDRQAVLLEDLAGVRATLAEGTVSCGNSSA
jgi:hypothetical protein